VNIHWHLELLPLRLNFSDAIFSQIANSISQYASHAYEMHEICINTASNFDGVLNAQHILQTRVLCEQTCLGDLRGLPDDGIGHGELMRM
jgi:hypothetical protein